MLQQDWKVTEFEPEILMFACNWCSYSGLDLAGTSRITYPPNVTVIRTMCSSRVTPSFVLEAFMKGMDGIIISSCHAGDCHYVDGNFKSLRKFKLIRHLLDQFGIDRRRVIFVGISASEAKKAKQVIEEMVGTLKEMGPFSLEGGK